jgi:hypothetical protein
MSKHKRRKRTRKFSTWILQKLHRIESITPEEKKKILAFFSKEFRVDESSIFIKEETERSPWNLYIYCSVPGRRDSWNYGLTKEGEFRWCSPSPNDWSNYGADLLTKKFKAL